MLERTSELQAPGRERHVLILCRYWEAKLAPGHVPAEAKIENFIRTKYESKRWAMDGPMPDPSTLDVEGDDDVVSVAQFEVVNIINNRSP